MIARNLTLLALGASVAGCSWSKFDELEDEAWVYSIGRPNNDSSNWGVAIAEMQSSGDGGRLAVIGANEAIYNEVALETTGNPVIGSNVLNLNDEYGLVNLDSQPILLSDPTSNAIALVARTGSSILVLNGENGQLDPYQIFGKERPDAATYMIPPMRSDATMPQPAQVVVAQDDFVIGAHYKDTEQMINAPLPRCALVDDQATAQPVLVRALGATRAAGKTYDDLVVWSSTGRLLVYDGGIFNGEEQSPTNDCNTGQRPIAPASVETGFAPVAGSKIFTFETKDTGGTVTGRFAVLAGQDENVGAFLALYNIDTLTLVGTPRTDERMRTAAMLERDGKRYVLAGFPAIVIDGVSSGQVQAFEVSSETGVSDTSAMKLADAQPENNQSFGRSIAVMNYNNEPIVAVAADNEIFIYYRSPIYDETRPR